MATVNRGEGDSNFPPFEFPLDSIPKKAATGVFTVVFIGVVMERQQIEPLSWGAALLGVFDGVLFLFRLRL